MAQLKFSTLQAQLPATGFIRQGQLIGQDGLPGLLPVSASTLWRLVRKGQFPAPVKLSANVTAWRAEDVAQWLLQVKG